MDIGQITHDTKYYDGYEFDEQVELQAIGTPLPILHIWDGYFIFIFGKPHHSELGWHGFTRDYCHFEGLFGTYDEDTITDLQEYIDDLLIYKDRPFRDEYTKGAYEHLLNWLITAQKLGCKEVHVKLY